MSTITVTVCQASPTASQVPPDAQIIIRGLSPEFSTLAEWDCFAEKQAQALHRALRDALPGGVYDRLLREMLAYKASHFRVAHGPPKAEPRSTAELVRQLQATAALDPEEGHIEADRLLVDFIKDEQVSAAFDAILKWYA